MRPSTRQSRRSEVRSGARPATCEAASSTRAPASTSSLASSVGARSCRPTSTASSVPAGSAECQRSSNPSNEPRQRSLDTRNRRPRATPSHGALPVRSVLRQRDRGWETRPGADQTTRRCTRRRTTSSTPRDDRDADLAQCGLDVRKRADLVRVEASAGSRPSEQHVGEHDRTLRGVQVVAPALDGSRA